MTDAELAILSLLAEAPYYADRLNDSIDAKGLRRWTAIGHSSMYYVLDKLERQGLVECVNEEHGRRLIQISAAGTGVLQTAVCDLLSSPHSHDKSFELGLVNMHVLKPAQIRSSLVTRRQDLQAHVARLEDEQAKATDSFAVQSMFNYNLTMTRYELEWLESFVTEWEDHQPVEIPQVYSEGESAPRMKQVVLPQDPDSIHKEPTQERSPSLAVTRPNRITPSHEVPHPDDGPE